MRHRQLKLKTPVEDNDTPKVEDINAKHGYDPDHNHYVTSGIVVDECGKVVGFGGVKVIYESVIIIDPDASIADKLKTVQLLISSGIMTSELLNIKDWHAFVSEPNFIKLLKKSYGFKECEGTALYVRLR